jgi:hypothetical protein
MAGWSELWQPNLDKAVDYTNDCAVNLETCNFQHGIRFADFGKIVLAPGKFTRKTFEDNRS